MLRRRLLQVRNPLTIIGIYKHSGTLTLLAVVGFRYAAVSTQKRQDRILKLYEAFCSAFLDERRSDDGDTDLTPDEKEALAWPHVDDGLFRNCRK